MDRLMCTRCGETLHCEGGLLKCAYCGATYEKEKAEESAARLEEALGNAKMELVANRKRHLWDVTHEKYPSKEKVVEAANAVISLSAEDFLARIYLHSHDRDPLKLNAILASSKVDPSEAAEAFRWLLPSLSSRTVGPLHDFVDRHFADRERLEKVTAIESEAAKISQGIYEPGLPRDVFLCYSSHDMPKVVGLLDLLEQNGFACFAAFRNLRHGKGAQEDYLSAIKAAMRSCEVLVFISSEASRSMDCDALKVELPYLIQELPDKPRVEFVIEDYGDTSFMVKRTLKKAFPSQEYCRDEEDLMVRIQEALEAKDSKKDDEVERLRKELEEARRAAAESAKKHEPKDEDALMAKIQKALEGLSPNNGSEPKGKQIEAGSASEFDEDELRKQAEEEARQELLREKMKKEAREKILAEEEKKRREEEERKRREEAEAKASAFRIDGNYIYYGRYPQAEVTDEATIKALRGLEPWENGYIQYNGEEYAEAKGTYFLVQPIKWRILERKGGEALVLSERILDVHRFGESYGGFKHGHYANNYKESEVRGWLNDKFLLSAFPSGDKRILTTEVDNSAASFKTSRKPYACENTHDKAFLPSYNDYLNGSYGFIDNASRQCSPTDYAVAKGAKMSPNGYGWYWTRSPYSYQSDGAWSVNFVGLLGYTDVSGGNGVRPGLRITIAE